MTPGAILQLHARHNAAFADFLEDRHGRVVAQRWADRLASAPESATAEALAWRMFSSAGFDVGYEQVSLTAWTSEDTHPDFVCVPPLDGWSLLVDVSALGIEAVQSASEVPAIGESGCFGLIAGIIRSRANKKNQQFAGADRPTLLVAGSFHQQADFLHEVGIDEYLLGTTRVTVPIDGHGRMNDSRDLGDAIFCRRSRVSNHVVSERRNISAILLATFREKHADCWMLLHHDARWSMPRKYFDPIPTAQLEVIDPERFDDVSRIRVVWEPSSKRPFPWAYED